MIFATAGHVDHGKTSLVKALSGVDTDRLDEEKARGLTIDLGFAYIHEQGKSIGFIDVPGHAKFISNMLAGVAAIDHALIIIAADDGPMPQTREHLDILSLLNVENATVVVTKIDMVDESHLDQVNLEIETLLQNTPLATSPRFYVSSVTLDGIDELRKHLLSLSDTKQSKNEQYFRLAIDRRFTVKGSGIVVTGSIFSGDVKEGGELLLAPMMTSVRVRSLHRQDTKSDRATLGDRCAINLSGDVNLDSIKRGHWLTNHPRLPVSTRLDVQLKLVSGESPFKTGTPVHIHAAAQHTNGRLFLLNQRQLTAGDVALAQLVCEEPISAVYGDRFILRDQSASRTLAGGVVLDPKSVSRGRSKPDRIRYLEAIAEAPASNQLDKLLMESGAGLNLELLADYANQPCPKFNYPTDAQGISYHPNVLANVEADLLQLIGKHKDGQIRKTLKEQLRIASNTLAYSLHRLIQSNQIVLNGKQYCLANQTPKLSGAAENLWQKIEPILSASKLQPPVIHELAKQVSLPPAALEKLMSECLKADLVVRPVKNRYFLPDAMKTLRELAISFEGEFSVIEFRDKSEIGRNLCIELLEHLDSKGFTKRLGDKRIIQDRTR